MVKKKSIIITGVFILAAVLFIGWRFYTPPLLNGSGYNLPARIYDFFAYVFYIGRAQWREGMGNESASRRDRAQAVWHKPSRSRDLLDLSPRDYLDLARRYSQLGLLERSRQLFRRAAAVAGDEETLEEIVAYLSILGDRAGAAAAARLWTEQFPESPRALYWRGRTLLERGRPAQALEALARLEKTGWFPPDAFYRAGRAAAAAGRRKEAVAALEKAVELLPAHRSGLQALARLGEGGGLSTPPDAAVSPLEVLTPSRLLPTFFGNGLALLGYDLQSEDLSAGGDLKINLYLENVTPGPKRIKPRLRLCSRIPPREITLSGPDISLSEAGEVIRSELFRTIPRTIYPGPVDLKLQLEDRKTGELIPPLTETGGGCRLASIRLSPRWLPSAEPDRLVREKFGEDSIAWGRSVFLGPGTGLEARLKEKMKVSALGLISYSHSSFSVGQGEILGIIQLRGEEGEEWSFPIRSGVETAEVWWEYPGRKHRKHGQAPIFRSWPASSGSYRFRAHNYSTNFRLPYPVSLTSLRFENISRSSGLEISELVFIRPPSGSGKGREATLQ